MQSQATPASPLYIGIDVGTSGCRAIAINDRGDELASARTALPDPSRTGVAVEQAPEIWREALFTTLHRLAEKIDGQQVMALALDGTSGTVFLGDAHGQPLTPALMYNDARAAKEQERIKAIAPAGSTTTALAKILWLKTHHSQANECRIHTQADWLYGCLMGEFGTSDSNNALKLGYDPEPGLWPEWIAQLGVTINELPKVVAPGTPVGTLEHTLAQRFGFNPRARVIAGTTDSTAAIIATGAANPGDAVTSLGSTLVVKVISTEPVNAPEYGIYSQPLGRLWLVGGASNSGGAVLRQFFSDEQMAAMTGQLNPAVPTGLDYYPLPGIGERFPVNDPALTPRMEPRPASDVLFFQGLLEGIARIERRGYQRLHELGAPYPVSVRSVGGGAANPAWGEIRGKLLGVPMLNPDHTEAAYGSALLARTGVVSS